MYDPALHVLRENVLLANIGAGNWFDVVHRSGAITLNGKHITIPVALFDSGALGAAYLSRQFLQDHAADLEPLLKPVQGSVKLASAQHTVSIAHSLVLAVAFDDAAAITHRANIQFFVLEGLNTDMIVGLPAIIQHFSVV